MSQRKAQIVVALRETGVPVGEDTSDRGRYTNQND